MPGKLRVKVTGTAGVAAAIRRLGGQGRTVAGEAAEAWARDIQATARSLAPVDTGTLRDAIDVRVNEGSTTDTAQVGVWRDDAFYARFVETGTRGRPGQPFLQPAGEAHRRDGQRHVREAVARRLR